ncbi:MAG: hypothetical protein LBJ72_05175 [Dysgonamonadaceae bacterium]|jgi:hypothetical protein|nr:hypothetical protein [Dysgonamonadaceae bacterium]
MFSLLFKLPSNYFPKKRKIWHKIKANARKKAVCRGYAAQGAGGMSLPCAHAHGYKDFGATRLFYAPSIDMDTLPLGNWVEVFRALTLAQNRIETYGLPAGQQIGIWISPKKRAPFSALFNIFSFC